MHGLVLDGIRTVTSEIFSFHSSKQSFAHSLFLTLLPIIILLSKICNPLSNSLLKLNLILL